LHSCKLIVNVATIIIPQSFMHVAKLDKEGLLALLSYDTLNKFSGVWLEISYALVSCSFKN